MTRRSRTARPVLVLLGVAVVGASLTACCRMPPDPAAGATGGASATPVTDPEAGKRLLDGRAPTAPEAVTGWYPGARVLVVELLGPRTPEVDRFLDGLGAGSVRIEPAAERPPLYPGGS